LTLKRGLDAFTAVYMPARNYSLRTREEYQRDLQALVAHLEGRRLASWLVVGLRDLQLYLAQLDSRGLEPSSRNRKTYAIKTFFWPGDKKVGRWEKQIPTHQMLVNESGWRGSEPHRTRTCNPLIASLRSICLQLAAIASLLT
jgi:hypothetical protein